MSGKLATLDFCIANFRREVVFDSTFVHKCICCLLFVVLRWGGRGWGLGDEQILLWDVFRGRIVSARLVKMDS